MSLLDLNGSDIENPCVDKLKVTAVIPCYNVSQACVDVITRAQAHADRIIAIDDGSTDDTLKWMKTTGCGFWGHNRGSGDTIQNYWQMERERIAFASWDESDEICH